MSYPFNFDAVTMLLFLHLFPIGVVVGCTKMIIGKT